MKKLVFAIFACSLIIILALSTNKAFGSPPEPNIKTEPLDTFTERSAGLFVNPQNRNDSYNFFFDYYHSANPDIGWTGDFSACNPGTTSEKFRQAVLQQINYFRAMAGVPADITFKAEYNVKAQSAALMMGANDDVSHAPLADWKCYSAAGSEAAGKSNLSLGSNGAIIITIGYMRDDNDFTGHRRWILFPQTQFMGTGDVPAPSPDANPANALWVFDENIASPRPDTREEYVAWPPPGFVPYPVVFARWSFAYANADFSNAQVSMTRGGVTVPVNVAPAVTGFGENALVWIPDVLNSWDYWPRPEADTTYTVRVSNVRIGTAVRDFTYKVTIFDPYLYVFTPIIRSN